MIIYIVILMIGLAYLYFTGLLGGIPSVINKIDKDEFIDDDCISNRSTIKSILRHEEGDNFWIDVMFRHIYTDKDHLEKIKTKLRNKCPNDPSSTTSSATTSSATTSSSAV
jgi:hypothetical protein